MAFGCRHVEESGSEFHRPRKRFKEGEGDDEEEVRTSCVVRSDDSEEEGLEKQETLQGMLKWLTSVAICPHDPSIGLVPHCSKWKECWIQVTRAKKALLVQRDNAELRYQNSPFLGNQTMHPSMYEDDCRSTGRSRYTIRRPHLSKPIAIKVQSL
ncbi:hypothetical protein Bca4012_019949 [Brassica carinata]|uniref:Uncharacterized protein n=1 Tax=Brassica carinata TaxID=52824 RepID=A0A8X7WJ36_BRACI|nr:hypothetical protein Bca52824_001641 [Brassica carinata]